MPTAITLSMPAMIIMICQKRRASLTMYAASCRGWRKVAYPNEARASAAIFPLCDASPLRGHMAKAAKPKTAAKPSKKDQYERNGFPPHSYHIQSNRSWLVSSRPALERLRLRPCTPCLAGATSAAAPAAWRSSPSSAAPRRASADLVAERCDAAICPELGEKRKCAGCA